MTKQEEIREGIRLIWNDYKFGDHADKQDGIWVVDTILSYLHSQGVVIEGQCLGGSHPHLSAYYTVEPLI